MCLCHTFRIDSLLYVLYCRSYQMERHMNPFLSTADLNHFFGPQAQLVSATPMARKQGNGNLTGFVRKVYDDGKTVDCEFIVNAKTADDVRRAYAECGLAA